MTVVRCAAGLAAMITAMLVQATVVGPLLYPVPVSLPLLVVVAVALLCGPSTGIALGFGAGLLADLTANHPVGLLALTWLGAGIAAGIVGGVVEAQRSAASRSGSARAWRAAIRFEPRLAKTRNSQLSRPGVRSARGSRAERGSSGAERVSAGLGRSSDRVAREARRAARRAVRDRRRAIDRHSALDRRRAIDRTGSVSFGPSQWRPQALLTGLIAAAATGAGLILVAGVGGNGGVLPAELVQIIPATLIDAILAVPVLALARAMVASAALRPVQPARFGGTTLGNSTPDRPMEFV